jgi:hypothetical protein
MYSIYIWRDISLRIIALGALRPRPAVRLDEIAVNMLLRSVHHGHIRHSNR